MRAIVTVVFILTASVVFGQAKKDTVSTKDTVFIVQSPVEEFISVADLNSLTAIIERSPEFDKAGYISVTKALTYLVQVATNRKTLQLKGQKK